MPHHKVIREFVKASTRSRRNTASGGEVSYSTPRQTKYPPWTQLPYLILVEIFRHAATTYSKHLSHQDYIDHGWLFTTALTCKSFSEPALSLLYESPPTFPVPRLRKLVEAISANPELGKKIRKIETVSREILDPKVMKFGFEDLVRLTPNIREICLSTVPWASSIVFFRAQDVVPPDLPGVLMEMDVELKNWTWHGDLCWAIAARYDPRPGEQKKMTNEKRGFAWMDVVHGDLKPFKTLTTLTLEKFGFPNMGIYLGEEAVNEEISDAMVGIATIAGALGRLKYLKDLRIKGCNFANGYFFKQLVGAHQLKRLVLEELYHCTGKDLKDFLNTSGKHLQELEVVQCSDLTIEFLGGLETGTPNLKRLLYEEVPDVIDEEVLDEIVRPSVKWPSTLESLVLRSLGNWNAEQCESFLRELVETAGKGGFMSLREIDVWCILWGIGWRERATSRRFWGDEFAKAFLDRRGQAWREYLQKRKDDDEEIVDEEGVTPGLCQTVLFRLDDSRPSENQLKEEDFLDIDERRSSKNTKRAPKQAPRAGTGGRAKAKTSTSKAKASSSKAATIKSKKSSPKTKRTAPTKRKAPASQSFVVGRKRPRYNDEEDGDFEADQLAYEDEDGDDSSWSYDENEA